MCNYKCFNIHNFVFQLIVELLAISGRVTTLESSGSSRQDSINILLSWKNIFETDVTGRLTALEGENNADSINALQTELESLWRRIHENQTLSLADLQSELVELINNLTQIVGRVEGQQSSQSTSISSLQSKSLYQVEVFIRKNFLILS